ncbi:helix-turn-helix domain-containing protein, partial [Mycobacterium sherrisii]|uniref:winged helix-turn-helix transcriptional regulator n=1 Tax=Mycobacterium sherrisii TaxID=243061 RepID=UPI0031454F2B
ARSRESVEGGQNSGVDTGSVFRRRRHPVALASEIVAERWNPLIVRNLLFGADTFSAIAHGVPSMSRSMLIKRLEELQRAGIITIKRKPDGRGHNYRLTEAGSDLAGVIAALAMWGQRWATATREHTDPAYALWAWCQVQLNHAALPNGRVVVSLTFPEERPGNRRFWMLIEHRDAELCYSDPGGRADLSVEARSQPFVDWHRGARSWPALLRAGDITLDGPHRLRRAFPKWNLCGPTDDWRAKH